MKNEVSVKDERPREETSAVPKTSPRLRAMLGA